MIEPIRTCIVCHQKRFKKELIRIVKTQDQQIQLDEKQQQQGRGVYLCLNAVCIQKAKEHNLIDQVFQQFIADSVYFQIATFYKNKTNTQFEKLIGFAVRARKCCLGTEATKIALNKGKIKVLILDQECSQSTRKKMRKMGEEHHIPIIDYFGSEIFGKLVGKTNCHCIGIFDSKFANELLSKRN